MRPPPPPSSPHSCSPRSVARHKHRQFGGDSCEYGTWGQHAGTCDAQRAIWTFIVRSRIILGRVGTNCTANNNVQLQYMYILQFTLCRYVPATYVVSDHTAEERQTCFPPVSRSRKPSDDRLQLPATPASYRVRALLPGTRQPRSERRGKRWQGVVQWKYNRSNGYPA
jgi:hypothetical protein